MTRRLVAVAVLLGSLATVAPPSRASDGWEVIERTDEGYEVAGQRSPGRDLPVLRGRGVLKGDILQVLAVVLDASRATQWAEGVSRIEMLERTPILTTLLYSYSDLTWPVSDRDVITRAALTVVHRAQEYKLEMHAEPTARPKKDGVIRIQHSDAHFILRKRARGEVWVEYLVDVDPGGKLPKWLIRWASKSIPGDTLRNLQRQVDKTAGAYDEAIARLRALP